MKPELHYLQLAKERILNLGDSDAATRLAASNLVYGIAKILYVHDILGLSGDVGFVCSPDFTITRSNNRWNSGFSYGGLLIWGNGNEPLTVLDPRPNTCGTLVGKLDHVPDLKVLVRRIDGLRRESNGGSSIWDFTRRNHFFALYSLSREQTHQGSCIFFLHGCPISVKTGTPERPGLSIDHCAVLREMSMVIKTPFGDLHTLQGDAANKYLKVFKLHEADSAEYRVRTAEKLVGDNVTLANYTHMGLVNMNVMVLGSYFVPLNVMIPFSTSFEETASLIHPTISLADQLPSSELATLISSWLLPESTSHALVPHGSGYRMGFMTDVVETIKVHERRYYVLNMARNSSKMVVSDISEIPYSYRPVDVMKRQLSLLGCKTDSVLHPIFTFKV